MKEIWIIAAVELEMEEVNKIAEILEAPLFETAVSNMYMLGYIRVHWPEGQLHPQ